MLNKKLPTTAGEIIADRWKNTSWGHDNNIALEIDVAIAEALATAKASEHPTLNMDDLYELSHHRSVCNSKEQPVEIPYRHAEYKEALGEIMHACKKAMSKTVGEPWRAFDKINRVASKQMVMMNTPVSKD